MICVGEEELICDLAETYHIYDYKSLPVKLVAIFSCGLREDSRIKRRLRREMPLEDTTTKLLVTIYDNLNIISWQLGGDENNRPESLFDKLYGTKEVDKDEPMRFKTGKDFKDEWKRRMM